jgi:Asp/Glu/hydantoin racemase
MRIWYQSTTTIGRENQWGSYQQALKNHINKIVRKDTQIDLHGVKWRTDLIDQHFYFESLIIRQMIENAIKAKEEGYDVFAVGCYMDSGLLEIPEVIDMPVAFSCQASLSMASLLARKFAILVPNRGLQIRVKERVKFYGLQERVTDCKVKEFEVEKLQRAFKDVGLVLQELNQLVESDSEAELIVIGDNILNMVLVENGIREIKGIPLMDITGCLVKVAEVLGDMDKLKIAQRSKTGFTSVIPKKTLEDVRKASQGII